MLALQELEKFAKAASLDYCRDETLQADQFLNSALDRRWYDPFHIRNSFVTEFLSWKMPLPDVFAEAGPQNFNLPGVKGLAEVLMRYSLERLLHFSARCRTQRTLMLELVKSKSAVSTMVLRKSPVGFHISACGACAVPVRLRICRGYEPQLHER